MLQAFLLLALSANPSPPAREMLATLTVRVQVTHTCSLSPAGVRCRGASGQPPVRVVRTARGVTIIEF